MLTFLFPGQGSQVCGMGLGLFDEFAEITRLANEIVGYSLPKLCLENPNQMLNQTQFTQPALFTVNALLYFKKLRSSSLQPDYVAGHSLGEYNALLAANVFDFETGLQIVNKRAELMSQIQEGGMAALLGLRLDDIKTILNKNRLDNITIANYNAYTQLVISGTKKDIKQAEIIFTNVKGVTFFPLKVSGAFHSPYMEIIRDQFSEFINQFKFNIPSIPTIANYNALPYHPAVINSNLINQISHSVKWTDIMEYLVLQGEMNFEEIGPGNVLKNLLQKILKKE